MVGHRQQIVAERLDLARRRHPFGPPSRLPQPDAEAELHLERPQPQNSVDRVDAGEHTAADQVLQRLGGAAAERAVAGAAIKARDRELVGKAIAAMYLDRLAGDA